ncbi:MULTISPECIES: TetR/AcrR family transcriptional regulator [unclassified Microbacterium]|uniref:TetR/AcrR family transcriptional regulator n=1 Tax=unclassified Microbacterium TaxID=2609290 RepID=UPI001604D75C|nr:MULTISPECIES: TetR/AcrR family transcriptional regulator [unclassified Microbacterium]QNA92963.1 TetR/AcrR family transcriptional regulator [Microbacterium sp. Se63.02b]QYM63128.1 TetR/AcrR family transcriptional regulator [Microbacterium sp. Se5.02b]
MVDAGLHLVGLCDVELHEADASAARELLTDGGLPALTVDQIAIRAGVSKNTSQKLRAPSSGSALERFRTQVHRVAALMNEPNARRPFVALVAASQHDPELATALRDRFIADRRASAAALLTEVVSEHPCTAALDPDIVIDLVYGALSGPAT